MKTLESYDNRNVSSKNIPYDQEDFEAVDNLENNLRRESGAA